MNPSVNDSCLIHVSVIILFNGKNYVESVIRHSVAMVAACKQILSVCFTGKTLRN